MAETGENRWLCIYVGGGFRNSGFVGGLCCFQSDVALLDKERNDEWLKSDDAKV